MFALRRKMAGGTKNFDQRRGVSHETEEKADKLTVGWDCPLYVVRSLPGDTPVKLRSPGVVAFKLRITMKRGRSRGDPRGTQQRGAILPGSDSDLSAALKTDTASVEVHLNKLGHLEPW
ncbi:hypothetical protein Baya_14939 [Bagarius yarrelli]|uniref:Uncharacterized protein n=1 Tax=Bagarius yarrelli TaxID=175774 RepID=A0A556VAC5_BAGYA|nr:hypothetical protein Baya_14939 [Bagarius yarrelli]